MSEHHHHHKEGGEHHHHKEGGEHHQHHHHASADAAPAPPAQEGAAPAAAPPAGKHEHHHHEHHAHKHGEEAGAAPVAEGAVPETDAPAAPAKTEHHHHHIGHEHHHHAAAAAAAPAVAPAPASTPDATAAATPAAAPAAVAAPAPPAGHEHKHHHHDPSKPHEHLHHHHDPSKPHEHLHHHHHATEAPEPPAPILEGSHTGRPQGSSSSQPAPAPVAPPETSGPAQFQVGDAVQLIKLAKLPAFDGKVGRVIALQDEETKWKVTVMPINQHIKLYGSRLRKVSEQFYFQQNPDGDAAIADDLAKAKQQSLQQQFSAKQQKDEEERNRLRQQAEDQANRLAVEREKLERDQEALEKSLSNKARAMAIANASALPVGGAPNFPVITEEEKKRCERKRLKYFGKMEADGLKYRDKAMGELMERLMAESNGRVRRFREREGFR